MKAIFSACVILCGVPTLSAQPTHKDVPYAAPPAERQVLDIYTPANAAKAPVVFWIHGGGWQVGDKSDVALKPKVFMEKGYVFVSTNYRLLPQVDMDTLIRDVAKSLGWVHKHITEHGGDPSRIFVMGHSAGAQLAALLCTDHRYLEAEGVPFAVLRGCVPVDGDTYDLPAIITTAEIRKQVHGLPPIKGGHREKFGNDPAKHVDFSAVTHITKGKGVPPFLILYVSSHPDTTAQAQRLANVLQTADVPVKLFAGRDTNHSKLNDDLGLPDDAATAALYQFVDAQIAR